jgi:hypothetical protein
MSETSLSFYLAPIDAWSEEQAVFAVNEVKLIVLLQKYTKQLCIKFSN